MSVGMPGHQAASAVKVKDNTIIIEKSPSVINTPSKKSKNKTPVQTSKKSQFKRKNTFQPNDNLG
jgi:uncharacterized protein YbcV (DUF1398 family)